jgi:hypothetical protein
LSLYGDGSFTYTPNAGYLGTDSFTYQVSDGVAVTAPVTVTLNVTDQAPVAPNTSFQVMHDTPLLLSASQGLLANARDADGDPLTVTLVGGPSHGTLNLQADGAFTYMPNAGFAGTDTFTYQVSDGVRSTTATAALNVTDNAPTAQNITFQMPHDSSLYVGVWQNAPPGLATPPADSGNSVPGGTPPYGPPGGGATGGGTNAALSSAWTTQGGGLFATATSTSVTLTDPNSGLLGDNAVSGNLGLGNLQPQTVARGSAAQAKPSAVLISEDQGLPSVARDADGDPLTYLLVSGPSDGKLTFSSDGAFIYVPNAGFKGSDSFTYEVSDGIRTCAPATVTLQVVNNPPTLTTGHYGGPNVSYSVLTNGILSEPLAQNGVLSSASDPDGDPLTATLVSGPSHGTLTFEANGTFLYQPNAGYAGSDSFTYAVSDGTSSVTGTAAINVTDTAPTPGGTYGGYQGNTLSYGVYAGSSLTIAAAASGVVAAASNPNGVSLTASLISGPTNGSLTFNADGSFTYTPNSGVPSGSDSFTYRLSDGNVSSQGAVSITIVNPNSTTLSADQSPDVINLQATRTVALAAALNTLNQQSNQAMIAQVQAQFAARVSYDQSITANNTPYINSVQPAQLAMWTAAMNAREQEVTSQQQAAARAAQNASSLAYQNTVNAAENTFLSGQNAAIQAANQAAAQAQAANQASVAAADAQQQASDQAARQAHIQANAQAQSQSINTPAQATANYQTTLASLQQTYQASLAQATLSREQTLSDDQAAAGSTTAQAQATLNTALTSATSTYAGTATQATSTRDSAVQQALNAYNQAVAQAQATYAGGPQDQSSTAPLNLAGNASYQAAVAQAQTTYHATLLQARTNEANAAITATTNADAAMQSATSSYQQSVQQANSAYTQAAQTASNNYDSSAASAQSDYQQSAQQAQATAANALQAANLAYDNTAVSAQNTAQAAMQAAQQTADAANAAAQQAYENTMKPADQKQQAFQAARTNYGQAAAQAAYASASQQATQTASASLQSAWASLDSTTWSALQARASVSAGAQNRLSRISGEPGRVLLSSPPLRPASSRAEDSLAEQVELRPIEHRLLYHFQTIHLALHLTIAPLQTQRGAHRRRILLQLLRKDAQFFDRVPPHRPLQPALPLFFSTCSDHSPELPRQVRGRTQLGAAFLEAFDGRLLFHLPVRSVHQ